MSDETTKRRDETMAEGVTGRHGLGNVAKLREALETCVEAMCAYCQEWAVKPCVNGCETLRMAKEALDAPARHCDIYPDVLSAMAELRRRHHECVQDGHPCREGCPECGMERCGFVWLLSAEEEGGTATARQDGDGAGGAE